MYGYVYLIVNNVNGHTYVGQHKSSNWQDRYMGSGKLLSRAKVKYGRKNFEKFLLESCYSAEELNDREIFWIKTYRERGKAEYNIANGGAGVSCPHPWNKDKKNYTEESRAKATKALRDYVKVHGHPCKGKHHSKEAREKMSASWDYEKHFTEKTLAKLRAARKGHKPNLGKVGKHWYNNGLINVVTYECPEGFVKGILKGGKLGA